MNKTLGVITVAIVLGLGGAAMAGDSGENHQDNTNTTGVNPFMPEFSVGHSQGSAAFGKIERPAVHHEIKK